ncbi:MAG TPA: hypothetical protein VE863_16375 [Pyrinomonadaceae bacterium]|nr:hypothetical protein [Pyrinomonadaceae bacterium]
MKKQILIALLVLHIIGAAQTFAKIPQTADSIDAFWAKFKAAVAAGNKAAVAQMTIFPVTMPYGVRAIKTKAELASRFKQVFHGETNAAKCFESAKPQKEPKRPREFTVGCDNGSGQEVIIYRFVLTKSGWKFKAFDNINE